MRMKVDVTVGNKVAQVGFPFEYLQNGGFCKQVQNYINLRQIAMQTSLFNYLHCRERKFPQNAYFSIFAAAQDNRCLSVDECFHNHYPKKIDAGAQSSMGSRYQRAYIAI